MVVKTKKLDNVPKLQTRSYYDKFASIWRQNDQNIQNKAKLQKQSNYDKFASIWRQNYQNVEVLRKTFKTTQN